MVKVKGVTCLKYAGAGPVLLPKAVGAASYYSLLINRSLVLLVHHTHQTHDKEEQT